MITWIRSHHRTAGALLILLSASVCATAQPQPLPRTRTTPTTAKVECKTGNISGRVVNESGQPLANANVWVRPATSDGLPVTNATTNRDGVFKFNGLERGPYTVNASMPAYIAKSPEPGRPVQAAEDSVTFVLMKGGVITGTVINAKGDPIVAIGVRAEMIIDESGRHTSAYVYEGVTDDRGVYRVYGLPSGTYIVSADGAANYSPTGVNAFAIDTPTYAPSSNREAADEISVRVGEETSTVDIRYRGERGSTITGTVKGTRTPDRGFSVSLTSLVEKGPQWDNYFQDAKGEFAFEGIPDGDYLLVATAHWNDRDRGQSEPMVLSVRGSDVEGIEITATPLASISGTVVLKELKEPAPECTDKRAPQPWETNVTAWHRVTQSGKKKQQFVWRSRGSESPNAQGNLTLRDLTAADYYFGVRLPPQQWYLQSIAFVPSTPGGQPADATRSWTTLKPGDQLSGLTFTLARGAALVRGEITLAEGQTLPAKLSVYLVPAEAAHAEEPLRYFASPVSTAGGFYLNNVAPGRYWILAQPGNDDTRSEMSKLRLPDAAKTRSLLRHAAEQRKTELELKPCQDVTVRLPFQ
ncbi:MAG TPA: carboxypeptidase-like regulatory domain-containing protein [Pyrinomonadaceae bacterium]|nr:carboxypeptidase-like regulatory domain-containing protein [Pyrinomonadaceae bacterium]